MEKPWWVPNLLLSYTTSKSSMKTLRTKQVMSHAMLVRSIIEYREGLASNHSLKQVLELLTRADEEIGSQKWPTA